jgi:hypothetical protein
MILSLSDSQLKIVMAITAQIPLGEKRSTFLERFAVTLTTRGRWDDAIVAEVAKLAATGLAHRPAA